MSMKKYKMQLYKQDIRNHLPGDEVALNKHHAIVNTVGLQGWNDIASLRHLMCQSVHVAHKTNFDISHKMLHLLTNTYHGNNKIRTSRYGTH